MKDIRDFLESIKVKDNIENKSTAEKIKLVEPEFDGVKIISIMMKAMTQYSNLTIKFCEDIEILMKFMTDNLPKEFYSLLWTKYLNLALRLGTKLIKAPEDDEAFKKVHSKLVADFIRNKSMMPDWTMLKKVKQFEEIFAFQPAAQFDPAILSGFVNRILESLDYLIWHDNPPFLLKYTQKLLKDLLAIITPENQADFIQAISQGRLPKGKFLEKTLIVGEDGGLFVLLNSLDDQELEEIKEVIGEDYLKDKITRDGDKSKIVIGKGAFGTVRFALSLFVTKIALPGQMVCIKKTKSVEIISQKVDRNDEGEIITEKQIALSKVVDSTQGDYFNSEKEILDLVYSPKILDAAINISSGLPNIHQKGYMMMEVVPQNTGTNVFLKNKNKLPLDWVADQKPYIVQFFEQTLKLLDKNTAFMDLKPDNTLYDYDNKKAYLIDLGGAENIKEGVEKCKKKNYEFQATPDYTSPEFKNETLKEVNLRVSLAFNCGKMLEEVVTVTKAENPLAEKLLEISTAMLQEDFTKRMTIEQGLEAIRQIGDDKKKDMYLFDRYIRKLRDRLKVNKASLGINQDIEDIKSQYIPPRVTIRDPEIFKYQSTEDLKEKFAKFYSQKESGVMLLLGNAGSGKSIALQLEFMKAVEDWDSSKPLPIYFNLANGIGLDDIIRAQDIELRINLSDFLFSPGSQKNIMLFIDSFDEGIYSSDKEREGLIESYLKQLGDAESNKIKLLVSGRTDFLVRFENYDQWFKAKTYQKFFIPRLNYAGDSSNTGESSLTKLVKGYFQKINNEKEYNILRNHINIEEEISSVFLFQMLVKTYSFKGSQGSRITKKFDIYQNYIKLSVEKNLFENYPLSNEQKHAILKQSSEENFESKLKNLLHELGVYIASALWIKGEFRLKKDDVLFSLLDFNEARHVKFKNQRIFYLLRNLPLKIEIKNEDKDNDIAIGFVHDTIKNFYLFCGLLTEAKSNPNSLSKILAARNMVQDAELIKMIVDGILISDESYELLTKYLLHQVLLTRESKTDEHVFASTNAMTILTAAKFNFFNFNFGNIKLNGANLTNCILNNCSFENADLSNSILKNAKLNQAKFVNTDLSNVTIGTYPKLFSLTEIKYSSNGEFLVAGRFGLNPVKMKASSFEIVAEFKNPKHNALTAASAVGDFVATYHAESREVTIWEAGSEKVANSLTLEDTEPMGSISLSPDGKRFLLIDIAEEEYYKHYNRSSKYCLVLYSSSGEYIEMFSDAISHEFSSNSKFIAIKTEESFLLINAENGEEIEQFDVSSNDSKDFQFSPNSLYFAVMKRRGDYFSCEIFNTSTSKVIFNHNIEGQLSAGKFTPDSSYWLFYGTEHSSLWSISPKKEVKRLPNLGDEQGMYFSSDGKLFATSIGPNLKLWDALSYKEINSFADEEDFRSVTFSPDGKKLVIQTTSATKVIDISFDMPLYSNLPRGSRIGTVSEDGKHMIICHYRTLQIFDYQKNQVVKTLSVKNEWINNAFFSPDNEMIFIEESEGTTALLTATGETLLNVSNSSSVKISPDCNHFAIGQKKNILLYKKSEFHKPKKLSRRNGTKDEEKLLAFSPNGTMLASYDYDDCRVLAIWDVITGNELYEKRCEFYTFFFTPDSKYFILVANEYSKLCQASNGQEVLSYPGPGFAVSEDSQILMATNPNVTEVCFYNLFNGQLISKIDLPSTAYSVVSSPNYKLIAANCENGQNYVWDSSSKRLIQTFKPALSNYCNMKWSADSKFLVSQALDIHFWKIEEQKSWSYFLSVREDTSVELYDGHFESCKMSKNMEGVCKEHKATLISLQPEEKAPSNQVKNRIFAQLLIGNQEELKKLFLHEEKRQEVLVVNFFAQFNLKSLNQAQSGKREYLLTLLSYEVPEISPSSESKTEISQGLIQTEVKKPQHFQSPAIIETNLNPSLLDSKAPAEKKTEEKDLIPIVKTSGPDIKPSSAQDLNKLLEEQQNNQGKTLTEENQAQPEKKDASEQVLDVKPNPQKIDLAQDRSSGPTASEHNTPTNRSQPIQKPKKSGKSLQNDQSNQIKMLEDEDITIDIGAQQDYKKEKNVHKLEEDHEESQVDLISQPQGQKFQKVKKKNLPKESREDLETRKEENFVIQQKLHQDKKIPEVHEHPEKSLKNSCLDTVGNFCGKIKEGINKISHSCQKKNKTRIPANSFSETEPQDRHVISMVNNRDDDI